MVVTGVTFTTQTRIQESEQAKSLGEMFAMKSVHYKRGKYHSFYRGLQRIPCCIEVQLRYESLVLFVFSKHLFLQRWSKWATPFVIKTALLSWYVQCKSTFIYLNHNLSNLIIIYLNLICLVSEFQVYVDEKHYFILFPFLFFEYRLEDFLTYDQRREIGWSDSCIGFLI